MKTKRIDPTPEASFYPLLIKNLLLTPLNYYPNQKIIYRDQQEFTYTRFGERVAQLAHALTALGVKGGILWR
jgi:fatty-acyl-CoA synthase